MPEHLEKKEIKTNDEVIWIIEDDAQLSKVITRSLKSSGFKCESFSSGKEFIDFLATTQSDLVPYPIVLLDIMLGDMNAVQLLSQTNERNKKFPFIVMTACGDEKTAVELMKQGAIDYIVKEKKFVNQIVKVVQKASEKLEISRKLEQSRIELEEYAMELKILNKKVNLQNQAIENEMAKTERLLQTVLPKKIARELLDKGYTRPKQFDNVSILFADVIGFSDLSKTIHPIELVTKLDNYFYIFDEIVEQHGLEKIKTIGDCYMCAGGIPEVNKHNPVITVLTGLKIQETIQKLKLETKFNSPDFRLRLGIHTGEVVAGVVGKIKFAYDIWGDAVNIASRIVEAGEGDKVNVSENTFNLVKDYFIFKERGEVMTKSKQPLKMYYIERLKFEYAADDKGFMPNVKLMKMLNLGYGIHYY
jgi:class 3 adenylate cyclase/CheY-like chemotaxis protein